MSIITTLTSFTGRPTSTITGNDSSSRHNSQLIAESRMERPFVWSISWRSTASSPARHVGVFQVDLQALVDGGYAYQEDDGRVRLKVFHHGNGDLVVQRNLSSPGTTIARAV